LVNVKGTFRIYNTPLNRILQVNEVRLGTWFLDLLQKYIFITCFSETC